MTRDQLIQQLKSPARRVRMMASKLPDFDFSGLDLTGADLRFSNLKRANFRGATLVGANLSFSALTEATFQNADLTNADLSGCNLTGVNMEGAVIEGIQLNYTSLKLPARIPDGPAEKLTLMTLLQTPVVGPIIGAVLGALLVYGFSGIIYFTNQIITAEDQVTARLYNYIIVQNITDGAVVFLMTWVSLGWLTRHFQTIWKRHLSLSVLVILCILAVNTGLYFLIGRPIIAELANRPTSIDNSAPWYVYAIGDVLVANIFLYVLQQGRQLTRKLSEQEYQLLTMEKLKTRAELDALQAKINPHFLYNSLNSIASLVHENPDKAEEMTMLLSKLFRYTTGRAGEYFISLADELEMVHTYLQVEQVRFGERLAFSVDVADPALNELRIPQFLLQPVVENSVKHGIAKSAGPGRIDVKIYRDPAWLFLSIHDSGPAFPDAMDAGYGLRSIQDKLKLLYGDDARVELRNEPYKQVQIAVQLARLKHPLVEDALLKL